jgi:hypothetical protein
VLTLARRAGTGKVLLRASRLAGWLVVLLRLLLGYTGTRSDGERVSARAVGVASEPPVTRVKPSFSTSLPFAAATACRCRLRWALVFLAIVLPCSTFCSSAVVLCWDAGLCREGMGAPVSWARKFRRIRKIPPPARTRVPAAPGYRKVLRSSQDTQCNLNYYLGCFFFTGFNRWDKTFPLPTPHNAHPHTTPTTHDRVAFSFQPAFQEESARSYVF